MLQRVDVGERRIEAYRGIAPDAILDALVARARTLRGARVLHVNATPYGGGVAELLRSAVPLLNDLGLIADWKIISGDDAFFQVTKSIHNGLQGAPVELSETARATYRENAERNAAALDEEYDFVFVHDPQPLAIPLLRGTGAARWIWRCHIDTANPSSEVWEFLRGYLPVYDAAVFTLPAFVPPDLPVARRHIVPPAIDPLSPKNLPLPAAIARQVVEWIGVRTDRPFIVQVSRFDPWKDPLGVIAAYRLVRDRVPGVGLVLAGSMASDDPEGWEIYRRVVDASRDDPAIHVFTNLSGVGNIEVNALQSLADVVVQKSLREGFGLVVSEALWKGRPVVAGRTGGIPLQMADGDGGLLVDNVATCGEAIVSLLQDRPRADGLAERGRARVREHFLLPRLLLDHIDLLAELAAERGLQRSPDWWRDHDPVCGMAIAGSSGTPPVTHGDRTYRFCSDACRTSFRDAPDRYLAS